MAEDYENLDLFDEDEAKAVATPFVEPLTDPEENAAKDNGGNNPSYPESVGHEPDVDFAREV